ncbi:MBL fold metallo-hydrolase [Mesorhizobium sp. MSK_1335]|uniref:MBL fold metallo-hydrolase n=1 Tax=Mesorhizobium montanum TaxID=3072323 RepID=A0ABU4ZNP6_9HYPH|nr:MBL fold metallo-hydrolase [Mesorhizobium sp. MSK_1335]MDX8527003.1 MBL fold metallo-hydrolase [Mesorhizobium sp. MSK_1335]
MFKLHVVQAQFGDSMILEFGTPAKPRYLLVDGGPPGNFATDLDAALDGIIGKGEKVDLIVLSHIDNDHVIGLLDLLAAMEDDSVSGRPPRVRVGGLWHNSFAKTIDPSGVIAQTLQSLMAAAGAMNVAMPLFANAFFGLREGHRLRLMAQKLEIAVNKGFKDDLILVNTVAEAIKLGRLKVTIAGPTNANLEALRTEWLKWLEETTDRVAANPKFAAMADKSVPNLSSIVVLAECDGKTLLLTGDARGDHICQGLKAAKLTRDGRLHVNVLKVQHHGSDRNTTRDFFDTITADTYVISANGKYGNPDFSTLKWIVEGAHDADRPITLVLTNETESSEKLCRELKPSVFGYTVRVLQSGKHSLEIVLSP